MRSLISHRVAALATLVVAIAGAGCGSSSSKSSSTSTSSSSSTPSGPAITAPVDAQVAGSVPAKIKAKGTLTVAADASYPPDEFTGSQGQVIGMDADLARALAGVMGLKANVVNATFDSIIPGLASGKYDLGMSSFTDTKEREKTVDFVTYFSSGTGFYTKVQGAPTVTGLDSLCGHRVAAEKGTTQVDDATAQDKRCRAAKRPGVDVLVFPDQNGANLALVSGRADIGMADSQVAGYQVKQSNGQLKLAGPVYGTAPYGIAIPKDSGMTRPVLAGVEALMAKGQYAAILSRWGLERGAISNPMINGAKS